jgi:hypothetical protein
MFDLIKLQHNWLLILWAINDQKVYKECFTAKAYKVRREKKITKDVY